MQDTKRLRKGSGSMGKKIDCYECEEKGGCFYGGSSYCLRDKRERNVWGHVNNQTRPVWCPRRRKHGKG